VSANSGYFRTNECIARTTDFRTDRSGLFCNLGSPECGRVWQPIVQEFRRTHFSEFGVSALASAICSRIILSIRPSPRLMV
jgi:hypothetical protein